MSEEGKSREGFFRRTFGPAGPMVMSVLWTFVIALVVWVLLMAASAVDIPGMLEMLGFFRDGILYLFFFILFLSYASYFMMRERRFLIALFPAAASAGVLAALWIAAGTLHLLGYDYATTIAAYAGQYMLAAPLAILAVGYAIVAALFFLQRPLFAASPKTAGNAAATPAPAARQSPQEDDERRLRELRGMMKEAEKKYLQRQIDRETFDKIARDYHERIAELEGKRAAGE